MCIRDRRCPASTPEARCDAPLPAHGRRRSAGTKERTEHAWPGAHAVLSARVCLAGPPRAIAQPRAPADPGPPRVLARPPRELVAGLGEGGAGPGCRRR
eukprot:5177697-Alexandrium_andersonii.AAC.1